MSKIIEAAQLPLEDKVYMKKDYFGWRVVQPIKNPDGTTNWLNLLLGGSRNALFLLAILLIVGFMVWSHYHDVAAIQANYANISADPIGWCKNVNANPQAYMPIKFNLTLEGG